jgi:hypothetical protein
MALMEDTNCRGRGRLPVLAALDAAMLMAPVAGASEAPALAPPLGGFLRDRSARFTTILAGWPAAVTTSPSEIDGEDSAREEDRTRWQPRSRAARRLEADGQLRGSQRFGGVVRQVESHRGAALRAGKQSQ